MNCQNDCPLVDFCNACGDCKHQLNDDGSEPCDKCTLPGICNPCFISLKKKE